MRKDASPVYSLELEKSLIRELVFSPENREQIIKILRDDYQVFWHEPHQVIYKEVLQRYTNNQSIDYITLFDDLKNHPVYGNQVKWIMVDLAGNDYLRDVWGASYRIRDMWLKRQMRYTSQLLFDRANDPTKGGLETLQKASQYLDELNRKFTPPTNTDIQSVTAATNSYIQNLLGKNGITGVPTGFPDLDKMTGGWQPSELAIIAGRPSMGKTALALSSMYKAAKLGIPTAFFSLEMSKESLCLRLVSSTTKIEMSRIRNGELEPVEMELIEDGLGILANKHIVIDDGADLGLLDIRSKVRQYIKEHDIKAVFVDYLQLMRPPEAHNREREVAILSRGLKLLAKEFAIPVIVLSQLNRESESRGDKRPLLSDLRESGSIEQDADLVIFVHRPEYYNIQTTRHGHPSQNMAEAIIAKQRNGPVGTVELVYLKEYVTFESFAAEYVDR